MRNVLSRRRALIVVVASLALIAALAGGAMAVHVFDDVPTNAYYHDDVTWLAAYGITAGCGGDKYCPNSAVTRGQMATFMHNLVDTTRTGNASCPGSTWSPASSSIQYTTTGGLFQNTSGSDFIRCQIDMPDEATITKVTWTVKDSDAAQDVACEMSRQSLVSNIGFVQAFGFAATSGTPGPTTLVDTTFTQPFVDNAEYAYFVSCALGTGTDLGIYGATVAYTYIGVPAP